VSAPPDSLVDGGRLQAQLGDPALRVLEATVYLDPPTAPGRPYDDRSGRADWAAAHIPGAAFADLVGELSEPHPRLRFTFPGAGALRRRDGAPRPRRRHVRGHL
jgi:thiosulfate/3-mercaptopyruvate sulfurtransferase